MKNVLYTLILLLLIINVRADNYKYTSGGRQASMGYTSVTSTDFWSVTNNQAGLAFYNQSGVGLYYENRFLLKEMGFQQAAFALKTQYGSFGVSASYSGDANYNTAMGGIAYSMMLGKNIAAGVQIDVLNTSLPENYGKKTNVTFEIGIMAKITENIIFGAHTFNPIQAKLSDYNDERIPSTINAGLSYIFNDKLVIAAEAFKQSDRNMEFRSGLEYKFVDFAFARIGIATQPYRYTFGVGLQLSNFFIDLSSNVHQILGYSPQISLQYKFGK
ncbi:MAG: hypothetical protein PHP31_01855 [Lentimicrobiaceae bacterium]|nr:hypothetical protein [Lentimicrobiaceae bacterium]